uniref:F-box only protein 50 n=1 Tax=Cavia porcellus TaxID=10141 RepID=A0A286XU65_CAVPO
PGSAERAPRGAVAPAWAWRRRGGPAAVGAGTEAEGPGSARELPPPPPSPPPPATPEALELPQPEPSEASARQLLLDEWGPLGESLLLPATVTWKLLLLRRPLYRNLLRSPNPEGINIYQPAPARGPTRQPLEALGNFQGWRIGMEQLQQNLSWTVKQQCVNLLAEGLWEELLDDEQPDITVMDWYEDSRLDQCVYELHVWLLASDCRTVIAQHHVAPRSSGRGSPGHWIQVSHVFRQYGPGVRFVHFLHKTKNRTEPGGIRRTRVTDSSVSVQLRE